MKDFLTLSECADLHCISPSAMSRWLRQHGVEPVARIKPIGKVYRTADVLPGFRPRGDDLNNLRKIWESWFRIQDKKRMHHLICHLPDIVPESGTLQELQPHYVREGKTWLNPHDLPSHLAKAKAKRNGKRIIVQSWPNVKAGYL